MKNLELCVSCFVNLAPEPYCIFTPNRTNQIYKLVHHFKQLKKINKQGKVNSTEMIPSKPDIMR